MPGPRHLDFLHLILVEGISCVEAEKRLGWYPSAGRRYCNYHHLPRNFILTPKRLALLTQGLDLGYTPEQLAPHYDHSAASIRRLFPKHPSCLKSSPSSSTTGRSGPSPSPAS